MKTKTVTIITIIAILLIAFMTNPTKEKHVNNAVEILFHDENDLGILSGMVETFYKPTMAPKVKMDNYFLFSISYIKSKKNKERINLGLGVFSQVIRLTDREKSGFESEEEQVKTRESTEKKSIENLKESNFSKQQKVKKEKILTSEVAERIAIKKAKEEARKKRLDELIGGIGRSEGTDSGSVSDKGQLNGDPYTPSYFGEEGFGNVGYGLRGRGKPSKAKVLPECDEEGRVVVEIHVNRQGRVIKAIPGKSGTTGDECLYDAARKTTLTYKWPTDLKAPAKQIGFVVINFSVSQ